LGRRVLKPSTVLKKAKVEAGVEMRDEGEPLSQMLNKLLLSLAGVLSNFNVDCDDFLS